MNEINAFISNAQESFLGPSTCEEIMKSLHPQRWPSPNHPGILIPDV